MDAMKAMFTPRHPWRNLCVRCAPCVFFLTKPFAPQLVCRRAFSAYNGASSGVAVEKQILYVDDKQEK
jgi:hypothetical protein